MEGSLVGFGVLATVAVTVYTLVRYARRPVRLWQFALGLLVAALITSVFSPTFLNAHGVPLPTVLITALCFGFAETVLPGWRRIALVVCTLCMLIALPWYALALADGERYTGNTHTYEVYALYNRSTLQKFLGDIPAQDGASYPAGWLAEQPFTAGVPTPVFWGRRFTPHPCWHSVFTGLYRAEVTSIAAWWPGGALAEEWWRRVEFRPREAPEEGE